MNERFKFRVWDSSANAYVPRSQFILLSDGTLIQEIGGEEVIWESTEPEFCTGLKDKNGKLIYEGDIVYSPLDGGTQKVIYWDDGLASFMAYNRYPDKHYTQRIGDGYFIELGFEVIGNIHENADLLENEE